MQSCAPSLRLAARGAAPSHSSRRVDSAGRGERSRQVGRCVTSASARGAPAPDAEPSVGAALVRRYAVLARPAAANTTAAAAVSGFAAAALEAYSAGYTEEFFRAELAALPEQQAPPHEQVAQLASLLACVFLTIQLCPANAVPRFASGDAAGAVSEATRAQWGGFVRLIVDPYFSNGYAWIPIARLQLEQTAVLGRAEPPPVVAERMSIVYEVLNTVCPRFPSRFE